MCLDPHALAKIEAREALVSLRGLFETMAASNVEGSRAGLAELATLEHLLDGSTAVSQGAGLSGCWTAYSACWQS